MSSSYVYEGPAIAEPIGNSFDPSPISPKPEAVQNIVTAKLESQDLSQQYQPLQLVDIGSGRICKPKNQPESDQSKGIVDVDVSGNVKKVEKPAEPAQQSLLDQIDAWASGLTPEQWKKYAVYAGIALVGKKLLFK
ncbi:hypothetical protein [Gracilimonas sediminicola]|uniref:hypothetical protein n=1 Tax=Gracilimonas sediminicola TaxID=2952158 RepID=UPI0038D4A9F3